MKNLNNRKVDYAMDTYQYFLELAENHPEYNDIYGQYRWSLGTWFRYAERENLFRSSGNKHKDEYRAGQLFSQFEEFHHQMNTGDRSPTGRMAQALIGLGPDVRRPEDWWPVGETPEEFK